MAEQLALPLPARTASGREDFYVSPANQAALEALDEPASWPAGMLAIVGPKGAGKSHLAQVFAAQAAARVIRGEDVFQGSVPALAGKPLVIDDAEPVADEVALFHLFNLMRASGQPLLLTARRAPARWRLGLPDLASRLATVPVAELLPPDDLLLAAVLAKHFSDRGIAPPQPLVPYLVSRIDRSLESAGRIVAEIDRAALAERRPIGIRLAGHVLDKMTESGA